MLWQIIPIKRFSYIDFTLPIAYLAIVTLWSIHIPFNGAPDEYSHFFLVEYLYHFRSMPHQWVDPARAFRGELTGAIYKSSVFWYYGMPNIHSFGAYTLAEIYERVFGGNPSYLAARAFNWLLAMPFITSLYSVSNIALDRYNSSSNRAWAWCGALLVALIPQVTFLFAYLNSDAFGITALAISVATLLQFLKTPTTIRAACLGLGLGLLLCAKVYYLPAIGLLVALTLALNITERPPTSIKLVSVVIITASAIAMPVLLASWQWYGDAFGMHGQQDFAHLYGSDPKFMRGTCFAICPSSLVNIDNLWWWTSLTFKSFFFSLGWLDIVLPVRAYQLFFIPITVTLFISTLQIAIKAAGPTKLWLKTNAYGVWVLLAFVVFANIAGSQRLLPQPQGRYLFSVIPFIPLLIALVVERYRLSRSRYGLALTCLLMFVFNMYGAFAVTASHVHPFWESPGYRTKMT